ncbi:tumor necrosis factor [Desmophyllum pertusum]|uniref:Tumor necrosis factor n=1 Tax=Desmophyllum pertusum TaxID=174260 RepID=A0A9X0CYV2_9CNID|nr:tumor necrosis factor [Desmophyllum pertusum]
MATVQMKFVLIFALLVNVCPCRAGNTTGKQNVCAASCNPININVHGNQGTKGEKGERGDSGTSCKCNLQDPNKPSAHIEAANKGGVTYQANNVIKEWSVSAPYSHLAGGMKYQDGKLTVPTPGRYYIYAQLYYYTKGRVYVYVNNKYITMIQPMGRHHGILYTGAVYNLKAGDVIMLKVYDSNVKILMYSYHSYFGAFLI